MVAVTRHNPNTHQSVVLVAHTAFNSSVNLQRSNTGLCLKVEGQLLEVEIEANLALHHDNDFVQDPDFINGLENFQVDLRTKFDIKDAEFVRLDSDPQDSTVRIELNNFKPGSIVAFRSV